MNSDIVVAMDESEDHERRVANVSETTITLTTVVTTTTSTETRIQEVEVEVGKIEERRVSVSEKVPVGEVDDGRACEGGDVMVEVLGSEVFVDGVRRHNGDVVSVEGDDGGKGKNLGDGVDWRDRSGGGAGRGMSLDSNDGLREAETLNVDKERVVETGVERGLERDLGDEVKVREMELAGNGDELHDDSESRKVETRSNNDIQNGIQHLTSQVMPMAHGDKDNNAAESVVAVKEEGKDKNVKVVEYDSVVSELRTKEEVISEKDDEQGVSAPSTHSQAQGDEQGISAPNTETQANECTMGSWIAESKILDFSIAGSQATDSDAGHGRDGNGESEGVDEERALVDDSLVKCVDGLECQADPSEHGYLDAIEGVKEQAANAEKFLLVGTTSHTEDETIKLPEPVTSSTGDERHGQVQGEIHKVDEKLSMGSVVPDVSGAASTEGDLVGSPKQDGNKESESHTGHEQPFLLDESPVEAVDQQNGCTFDILPVDTNAMEGAGQVGSNTEDIQHMHEDVDISERVDSPEVEEEDEQPVSDSTVLQSNDGNEEREGHSVHLPDESVVNDVDQGNKCILETLPVDETAMIGAAQAGSDMEDSQEGQEEAGLTEEAESPDEPEVDEDPVSGSKKRRSKEERNVRRGHAKSGNLVKEHWVSYQLPPENEGEFSVFDLVWGKVKSHPWWPGQIFHPFDSSEKAKKYIRKDCYLVAYFGDKSFAWNDGSVLKPFFKHFVQEEKQSNSEAFQNAVNCALEEVSRRVELGLGCSCISEEVYDNIKYQIVENAGIREESSKREGIDCSTGLDFFQPKKLIEYVRALALSPTSGASRLDLVIAKAQLLAFYRLKGFDALPDFQYYDGLMECDTDTPLHVEHGETELVDSVAGGDGKTKLKGPHRRKHNLKDIVYERRKEKTLTELMGDTMYYIDGDFDSPEEDDVMLSSPTSGTKRKASSYLTDDCTGQQSTKAISVAKVSHAASPNPQQSFKVGECIQRVASQLTGSSSIMKITSDESNSKHVADDANEVANDANEVCDPPDDSPTEELIASKKEVSTDEMLSQLHLSARDPMKGYSYLADVVSFFSEFRNLAVSTQRQRMRKGSGRKRKSSVPVTEGSETFEFDDRNDSYWTDMVVQNSSEAKPSRRGRKRKEDRLPSGDSEKPLKSNLRKYSRKQYFHGNNESAAEIPSGNEKQQEQLPTGPTELMLSFSEGGSIPSEVNLNKMFRRFGPLKESETEIDTQSCRAKVVFKKHSDAEVALSSATMFNIFGSTLVNYQLNHTPSVPFGTAPLALSDGREDAT